MNKYVYLIRNTGGSESYDDFRDTIFDSLGEDLRGLKPERLKINMSVEKPPRASILPLEKVDLAMVSMTGDLDNRLDDIHGMMIRSGGEISSYRVAESPYLTYKRDWDNGTATPGLMLLTLLQQKEGLSGSEFMRIWFEEHSPLAVTIHPLFNYVRNVVEEALSEEAFPFNGIVEEHFRNERDLLNPLRMFGGLVKFIPNTLRVYRHVNTFINLDTIENYICREYHLIG